MLARSISFLHLDPNLLSVYTLPKLKIRARSPTMVHSHPTPIALMSGCAMTVPMQEKMFLTKLLTAMPLDDLDGMNSVSIVVAAEKISMLLRPNSKLATLGTAQYRPLSMVQPNMMSALG
ncbi:uncharacterized protein PgNI_01543 [Pyricularia grisea]|uniref:Uncharacterized protein n=1 Tax=Pyricularia grisea TaxID=148305 RepID=A0A6P8BLB4_PYRGI|nr:uncharacterized protein PgNI_01543 [Pyricularia grisea]TLD17397.1 hypothetical protein PgNI_01543 [Pyricularia grisea]